jgi:hypothetical protein
MSGHAPDYTTTLSTIPERKIPSTVKNASIGGIAIGLAATAYGLFGGDENLVRETQGAFITNFMYWNGIAIGGFIFSAIGMVTYARWHRRFKRISESFAMFLPVSMALLLVFLLAGGIDVYPWADHNAHLPAHKAVYFKPAFFYARIVIGLGILAALSYVFVQKSLRADLGVAREQMKEQGLEVPASWEAKLGGWSGAETEIKKAQSFMLTIAPVLCASYAIIMSMISVDISMSLAPHFFANMFPAWYFMSAGWSGLIWTAIIAIGFGKWMGIENLLRPKDFHDIGKLTFAFCMFWGYTTFAQYLPIWYGNMTEEIGYILYRSHGEVFSSLTRLTLVLCFVAPWTILLSRGLKKQPKIYFFVAVFMALGLWLERYIVNMPSIHSYHMPDAGLPFGFVEIGMTAGFLGAFLLVVLNFLAKYPAAVLSDPYMHDDPDHIECHPHHH